MRIVFISNEIGVEAPGIVFQKIITNLLERCDVRVYSPLINDSVLEKSGFGYCFLPKLKKLPYLVDRIMVAVCGHNICDWLWAKKCAKIIAKKEKDVDVLVCGIASNNCATIYIGKSLAERLGVKWVVYSVDAIPAPLGWSKNNAYYRSLRRFMKNETETADAFFSSNPVMLKYQLSCLSQAFKGYTGVVYTPFSLREYDKFEPDKDPVFLYTGSLYGLRHVDTLLEAFLGFIEQKQNAKLVFVGDIDKSLFSKYDQLIVQGNLQIVGYTSNLESYYAESTVLLDLSADIPNDVFLSSKIVNYLPLKRPIITIGGENSAAAVLFNEDKSIIISSYQPVDILIALKKSVTPEYMPGEGRKKYVKELNDKVVTDKFYNDLVGIVSE